MMLSIVNPEEPLGLLELVTVVIISGGGEIGARGSGGIITENGGDDLGGCCNFMEYCQKLSCIWMSFGCQLLGGTALDLNYILLFLPSFT